MDRFDQTYSYKLIYVFSMPYDTHKASISYKCEYRNQPTGESIYLYTRDRPMNSFIHAYYGNEKRTLSCAVCMLAFPVFLGRPSIVQHRQGPIEVYLTISSGYVISSGTK